MHLPIGVSDFRKLVEYKDPTGEGYLYVDKTSFIREITYDSTEVIIITRPRRFGKTLNLSMLQYFYAAEVEGKSTKELFDGLEISKYPDCMQEQGKYPVIFVSFKDVKAVSVDSAMRKIYEQVRQLYENHRYVLKSEELSQEEKEIYTSILSQTANFDVLSFALRNLSHFISKVSKQQVYILIDEYDTPIQESYLHKYYEGLISFMRVFLGSALKGNVNLKQAVLTGILRVSKESLFSDLNNVKVYSILNSKYSSYFGFTENEVNDLLDRAKLPAITHQLKEWYNGYTFGKTTIYNPFSIVEFIKEEGQLSSYWVNTSGNDLIGKLVIQSAPAIQEKIANLMAGKSIREIIDEHVVFSDLDRNPSAVWNLFLMSGYLKATVVSNTIDGVDCELSVPNKEIESLYKRIVREWLFGAQGLQWYQEFLADLANGRVAEFEKKLQTLIDEVLSYHDVTETSQESFHHGLMLAFVSGLKDTHELKSNKESGNGRYDVAIIPKDISRLGIVLEFKAVDNEAKIEQLALEALEQIKNSKYIVELQSRGVSNICQMGIAFSGKVVKILSSACKATGS